MDLPQMPTENDNHLDPSYLRDVLVSVIKSLKIIHKDVTSIVDLRKQDSDFSLGLSEEIKKIENTLAELPAPKNGVSTESAFVNDKGELILKLTDGTQINCGVVKGENGKTPKIDIQELVDKVLDIVNKTKEQLPDFVELVKNEVSKIEIPKPKKVNEEALKSSLIAFINDSTEIIDVKAIKGLSHAIEYLLHQYRASFANGNSGGGSFAELTGSAYDNASLTSALNAKQNSITLTTVGSSGVSTLIGSTLNIPNYTLSGLGMAFGTTTQIPRMNAGGTGFIYSSGLTYNGSVFNATGEIIASGALKGDSVQLANNKAIYFNSTVGSNDSYFYRDGANDIEMYNGVGFHILDATLGTKVATGLYPKTNDSAPIGSTSLKWSDLFLANGAVINFNAGALTLTHSAGLLTLSGGNMNVVGTLSADRLGISSLKAVFGERYATFNEFNDVLWRADKRFTVTSSNGYSVATLFKGGFENTYTIPVSTTEVININLANQSGVPAVGVTYPEGKFYVHFYYINNNYSAISARTKHNGVWYALPTPINISTVAGDKVLEFQVSSNNYMTDIELTITTNGSDSVLVTALNYICDRWTAELELPYFDKFALTNSIMGNTRFRTVAQTTSGNINADGDWYMGVGGTGGKFGIGTSTPGAYHLNVVGNILGNDITTNSGSVFQSLGVAYLRANGTSAIKIGDSAAQQVELGVGGGAVGVNTTSVVSGTKLQVNAGSGTASSTILKLYGSSTGFSGSNDAGTAYALTFDACSYQTSIKQSVGAKIEMVKENTWNYADTPTGINGSLVFYTSSGTPNAPVLTEGLRINSAQKTTFNGVARLKGYTVATLPTGAIGDMAYITDGDAGLAWGATATNSGGGATKYQVWYNNANWTIVGK